MLGEAATAWSPDLRDRHSDIPWRDVIAQRNVVVHEYHRLDIESLWATAKEDIPQLDQRLAAIEATERGVLARRPARSVDVSDGYNGSALGGR